MAASTSSCPVGWRALAVHEVASIRIVLVPMLCGHLVGTPSRPDTSARLGCWPWACDGDYDIGAMLRRSPRVLQQNHMQISCPVELEVRLQLNADVRRKTQLLN